MMFVVASDTEIFEETITTDYFKAKDAAVYEAESHPGITYYVLTPYVKFITQPAKADQELVPTDYFKTDATLK